MTAYTQSPLHSVRNHTMLPTKNGMLSVRSPSLGVLSQLYRSGATVGLEQVHRQ